MVNYIVESVGIHYCTKMHSLVNKSDQLENLPLGGLPLTCSKGSRSPLPGDTSTLGKASFEGLVLRLGLDWNHLEGLLKHRALSSTPRVSASEHSGDVDAAGPGTTL